MMRSIKSTMLVAGGLCWLGFAVGFGFIVLQYLAGNAGWSVFGFFGVSALISMVHVIGFSAATFLCFTIGVGLCVHGIVPTSESPMQRAPVFHWKRVSSFIWGPTAEMQPDSGLETAHRCVRCRAALATPVHLCPECGWTQPLK